MSGLDIGCQVQEDAEEDATIPSEVDQNGAPVPECPLSDATAAEISTDAQSDDAEDPAEPSSDTAEPATDAPSEPREVYLTKKCGAELGLIVSSTDADSLVVSFVLPRGVAERSMDSVEIGDEILSVNGVKLKGAQIEFAQTLVISIEGSVRMEVRQNKKLVPMNYYYL